MEGILSHVKLSWNTKSIPIMILSRNGSGSFTQDMPLRSKFQLPAMRHDLLEMEF